MANYAATALFDSREEAERAINDLRQAGISDDSISVIANRDHLDGDEQVAGHDTDAAAAATDVAGKAAAGAGVGALLGVAALAIPGVGPLIATGAIAQAAIGGAAVTGTAIGAAAGGIAGLLTDHGVHEDDARYYDDRVNNHGGILVAVDHDTAGTAGTSAEDILYRHGGHSARRARAT